MEYELNLLPQYCVLYDVFDQKIYTKLEHQNIHKIRMYWGSHL